MKRTQKILIGLVPGLPLLLFIILWPITIKAFGCACNFETKYNGNWIGQHIMWPVTLATSFSILVYVSGWINGAKKLIYLIVGGILQVVLSLMWGTTYAM